MGRWYDKSGEPHHFVAKANGNGTRPTTIRDARKNSWIPSVTTITKDVLRSPGLERYFIRQAVEAVVTAPDVAGEGLDAKIVRVLDTESQQDEEAKIARDRGTEIHDALEALAHGKFISEPLKAWVEPAWEFVRSLGSIKETEKVLVGDGYAGRTDLIIDGSGFYFLVDYKTAKTFPKKEPWPEHRLQLSAYAEAYSISNLNVRVGNLYISTVDQGKFEWMEHLDWRSTYRNGFVPLFEVWKWINNFGNTSTSGEI